MHKICTERHRRLLRALYSYSKYNARFDKQKYILQFKLLNVSSYSTYVSAHKHTVYIYKIVYSFFIRVFCTANRYVKMIKIVCVRHVFELKKTHWKTDSFCFWNSFSDWKMSRANYLDFLMILFCHTYD